MVSLKVEARDTILFYRPDYTPWRDFETSRHTIFIFTIQSQNSAGISFGLLGETLLWEIAFGIDDSVRGKSNGLRRCLLEIDCFRSKLGKNVANDHDVLCTGDHQSSCSAVVFGSLYLVVADVAAGKLFPVIVMRPLAGPTRSASRFMMVNVLALMLHPWASFRSTPAPLCAITFALTVFP